MPKKKAPKESSLQECDDGQMYARVTKLLGNYRVTVYCQDDQERMAMIRGSMRKKVWISVGDIVVISLRECVSSDEKADLCDRIDPKIVHKLRKSDPTLNPKLFMDHESKTMSGISIHEKEESTGFEFGDMEESSSGSSASKDTSTSFNFDDI